MMLVLYSLVAFAVLGRSAVSWRASLVQQSYHLKSMTPTVPSESQRAPEPPNAVEKGRASEMPVEVKGCPTDDAQGEDLAPSIATLKLFLHDHGLLEDEKLWVDRPLRPPLRSTETGQSTAKNGVDAALAELQTLVVSSVPADSDVSLTKEKADAILDRYFGHVEDEVQAVFQSDVAGSATAVFTPAPWSGLQHALDALDKEHARSCRDNVTCCTLQDAKHVALDALQTFALLERRMRCLETTPPREADMQDVVYTKSDVDSRIERVLTYLTTNTSTPATFLATHVEDLPFSEPIDARCSVKRGASSVIPMRHNVVVPGGRFAEFYYWDSYWILRGLALAGKSTEASNQLLNFFSLIDRFGFVPNGARRYYLDRSQPPLLAASVDVLLQAARDDHALDAAELRMQSIPRLLQEYLGFWMNPETGHVVAVDTDIVFTSTRDVLEAIRRGVPVLNRYYSKLTDPRPESYVKDSSVVKLVEDALAKGETIAAGSSAEVMRAIRAAAESGWDFSVRWSRDYISGAARSNATSPWMKAKPKGLTEQELRAYFKSIDTTSVLPVDLNAFLYVTEQKIAEFLDAYSQETAASHLATLFRELSAARHSTMSRLMWDSASRVWRDWDIKRHTTSEIISAASVVPLWAGMSSFGNIPLHPDIIQFGGIVPTMFYTGQQWDAPNVWPPLIHMAVEYLDRGRSHWTFAQPAFRNANEPITDSNGYLAQLLARWFVRTVMSSYHELSKAHAPGRFYEKYNALHTGTGGSGGEYPNQVGFGWTNGVVIELITRFAASQQFRDLLV